MDLAGRPSTPRCGVGPDDRGGAGAGSRSGLDGWRSIARAGRTGAESPGRRRRRAGDASARSARSPGGGVRCPRGRFAARGSTGGAHRSAAGGRRFLAGRHGERRVDSGRSRADSRLFHAAARTRDREVLDATRRVERQRGASLGTGPRRLRAAVRGPDRRRRRDLAAQRRRFRRRGAGAAALHRSAPAQPAARHQLPPRSRDDLVLRVDRRAPAVERRTGSPVLAAAAGLDRRGRAGTARRRRERGAGGGRRARRARHLGLPLRGERRAGPRPGRRRRRSGSSARAVACTTAASRCGWMPRAISCRVAC